MSDRAKKISELNAHSNAPGADLLVIVNQAGTANAETKKITLNNLFANVASNVAIKGNTFTVAANTTISGPLVVSNTANISSNVALSSSITISGNTTANNIALSGNAAITGSITIAGNTTANNIVASGNVTVGNIALSASSIRTGTAYTNTRVLFISNNTITGTGGITFDGASLVVNEEIVSNNIVISNVNDYSLYSYENVRLALYDNVNSYSQILMWNTSSGNQSSSDFVVTADTGSDTSNFGDFGINGSTYSNTEFTIFQPLDVYLYSSDSRLVLGTAATNNVVVFTGGTTNTDVHSTFYSNGQLRVEDEVSSSKLRISNTTSAPASAIAAGTTGEIRIDSNYIYVCVANNTWKRSALSTW